MSSLSFSIEFFLKSNPVLVLLVSLGDRNESEETIYIEGEDVEVFENKLNIQFSSDSSYVSNSKIPMASCPSFPDSSSVQNYLLPLLAVLLAVVVAVCSFLLLISTISRMNRIAASFKAV